MKLKLLLDREPIGAITEQTLGQVWTARYGNPFEVQWLPRDDAPSRNGYRSRQHWICNAPLNVIFLPGTNRRQLEPIQREFGRSLVRWRQPLQSTYLQMALSPRWASAFRCATLAVRPEVPDGRNWIIIPGNHKIRLLNRAENSCLVAAKHGFPQEPMRREIDVHTVASSLDLPVVPMLQCSAAGDWYLERYICGTPLNRWPCQDEARAVASQASAHLRRLLDHGLEYRAAADYADQLAADLDALIRTANLCKRFRLPQVSELIDRLAGLTRRATWTIPIGQTHGDFQPANILMQDDRYWIIDWELTRRRQAAYDPLVFFLAARFPQGLAERLQSLGSSRELPGEIARHVGSAYDWTGPGQRNSYLAIFLLEDVQWRLEQLAPSIIHATGGGN